MNRLFGGFIKTACLAVMLSSAAHAEHDNGQGKSQDHPKDPLLSVSVAPEPSTFWLLLSGTLMIAVYVRHKKKTLAGVAAESSNNSC
jgi:hypothetical protein